MKKLGIVLVIATVGLSLVAHGEAPQRKARAKSKNNNAPKVHLIVDKRWTAPEKEVWNWVLDTFHKEIKGDVSFNHPECRWWWHTDLIPNDTGAIRLWNAKNTKDTKVKILVLKPVATHVNKNVACVHYSWNKSYETAKGEEKEEMTRITETYVKEDGKWSLLWGQGGPIELK